MVSQSGYYDYVRRMDRKSNDEELAGLIGECRKSCKRTYGYRGVMIWLERDGIHHNPKTILRVMQKYGLRSVIRRRRYQTYAIITATFLAGIQIRCIALWLGVLA